MTELEAVLHLEKVTKTTYQYREEKPDLFGPAGVVYIAKEKLPTKPRVIKVTVVEIPPL